MKNFRTFVLAVNFYEQIRCHKLSTVFRDQLERASQSIALNLAEGYGRGLSPDQKRFYRISMGSLRECQAILVLARLEGSQAWKTLDTLGAHLYKLIYRAWEPWVFSPCSIETLHFSSAQFHLALAPGCHKYSGSEPLVKCRDDHRAKANKRSLNRLT